MILRKPSDIVSGANVRSRRDYAIHIFRSLQKTDKQPQLFDSAFVKHEDCELYEKQIRARLDTAISCIGIEDFIFLPPLFIRAHEDAVVHLSNDIVLVMFREGPIFPVLWQRSPVQHAPMASTMDNKHDTSSVPIHTPTTNAPIDTTTNTPTTNASIDTTTNTPSVEIPPETIETKTRVPSDTSTPTTSSSIHTPTTNAPINTVSNLPKVDMPTMVSEESVLHVHIASEDNVSVLTQAQDEPPHLPQSPPPQLQVVSPVANLTEQQTEKQRQYIERLTKTPLPVGGFELHTMPVSNDARDQQFNRYLDIEKDVRVRKAQMVEHENLLANPSIEAANKAILQLSLARKVRYMQDILENVALERRRLFEAQGINEVTCRVLLDDKDADPRWQMDMNDEYKHLQRCIDVLTRLHPSQSV